MDNHILPCDVIFAAAVKEFNFAFTPDMARPRPPYGVEFEGQRGSIEDVKLTALAEKYGWEIAYGDTILVEMPVGPQTEQAALDAAWVALGGQLHDDEEPDFGY